MLATRTLLSALLCLVICVPTAVFFGWLDRDQIVQVRCDGLLTHGQWRETLSRQRQNSIWSPDGCMIYPYTSVDSQSCLSQRQLTFLGDSTARQLFWAVSKRLDYAQASNATLRLGKHENITFQSGLAGVRFIWDPFLNTSGSIDQLNISSPSNNGVDANLLVVGTGLWHVKHLQHDHQSSLSHHLRHKFDTGKDLHNTLFLPVSTSQVSSLTKTQPQSHDSKRSEMISENINELLETMNNKSRSVMLKSYLSLVEDAATAFEVDGVHIKEPIASAEADILLNYFCNSSGRLRRDQSMAYCCVPSKGFHALQIFMVFSALGYVIYRLISRWTHTHHIQPSVNDSACHFKCPLMADAVACLCLALMYCFIADRTLLFDRPSKLVDQTSFIFLSVLAFLLGLFTSTQHTSPTTNRSFSNMNLIRSHVLSRSQTEEWKGWMQIVILLYHYFGMSKILWSYQLARLLVASYIFMTGYGHTMYFIKTGDFSLHRFSTVILRTNLLSIVLAFVMGTQFDLYYFPALSSVWFIIIYITLAPASRAKFNMREILFRIVLSALIVRMLAAASKTVESLFGSIGRLGIGLPTVDGKEFMFRFGLDVYVAYFGMLIAVFCSQNRVEHDQSPRSFSILSTQLTHASTPFSFSISLCILLAYACFCGLFSDKYRYNRWHPVASPFAVVGFVILRNSTKKLSTAHSRLFVWFGRSSLETFVLQYHIWLAADSRGLLRLDIFHRLLDTANVGGNVADWTEFLLVSTIFLWASSAVSKALPIITAKILEEPQDHLGCEKCGDSIMTSNNSSTKSKRRLTMGLRLRLIIIAVMLWGFNLAWACLT